MKMTNGMSGDGSIYKTKTGWIGQIIIGTYDNGGYKYKRFKAKLQKDVIQKMKQYKLLKGTCINDSEIYLEDYLESFMNTIKRNKLKPTSFDREYRTFKLHIKPYIGHYYLSQLTTEIIQIQLINELKLKCFSFSSIHKAYILLNSCLRHAKQSGKISNNPCELVEEHAKGTFKYKEIRFFNENEIIAFSNQALSLRKTSDKYLYKYGIPITLIIYMGLRGGKLCALKWDDVNFTNRTLNVSKNTIATYDYDTSDNKKRVVREQLSTKTSGEGRIIPLSNTAIFLLQMQFKITGNELSNWAC